MVAASSVKGRDYLHRDTRNRVRVIDVRSDSDGRPTVVLIQGIDVCCWMGFDDFAEQYEWTRPANPAQVTKRSTSQDAAWGGGE